mmetsp:Transcript_22381/g.40317  ORF Transcript_22381/g.40317 Transcript_22381/m.40317 type:complete len:170 (+) Transcript_22381:61-570(+)
MVHQLFILFLFSCVLSVGAKLEQTVPGHDSRGGCDTIGNCGEGPLEGDNSVLLQHPLSSSANSTLQKDVRATILIEDESQNDKPQHAGAATSPAKRDERLLLGMRDSRRRRRDCKNRRRRRNCDDNKCKGACTEKTSDTTTEVTDGYCAATTEGNQDCVCSLFGLTDCR